MNHEDITNGLESPPPVAAPRDLAAVIDAMLAEIPPDKAQLRHSLTLSRTACVANTGDPRAHAVDVAEALATMNAYLYPSDEPWYERVMAIWSEEAWMREDDEPETLRQTGERLARELRPQPSNSYAQEPHGLPCVGIRTAEGITLTSPESVARAAGKVEFACGSCRTIVWAPPDWEPSVCPDCHQDALAIVEHVGPVEECMGSHSSPTGDTPNLAGEAWAGDPVVNPYTNNIECADCHGEPEIVLIAQKVAKCVSCFITAAMNTPCFQCGKNPTEAIVRAIGPDGKDDTVGTCINCLLAHVSAGRN